MMRVTSPGASDALPQGCPYPLVPGVEQQQCAAGVMITVITRRKTTVGTRFLLNNGRLDRSEIDSTSVFDVALSVPMAAWLCPVQVTKLLALWSPTTPPHDGGISLCIFNEQQPWRYHDTQAATGHPLCTRTAELEASYFEALRSRLCTQERGYVLMCGFSDSKLGLASGLTEMLGDRCLVCAGTIGRRCRLYTAQCTVLVHLSLLLRLKLLGCRPTFQSLSSVVRTLHNNFYRLTPR